LRFHRPRDREGADRDDQADQDGGEDVEGSGA
jgi:hypothetical protein